MPHEEDQYVDVDRAERQPVALVTTKPDTEVAADFKRRLEETAQPMLAIFDEAVAAGFIVQWDAIAPMPPLMRTHRINGLRLVKHF